MTEHCYCPVCGTKNHASAVKCTVCASPLSTARKNPVNSAQFRAQPMAVFDIDMTILDSRQRFKDAQRAGLVDKDGKAKKKSNFETMGKAMKRRNEFLYKPSNMDKDRVMDGALTFINELVGKGYLIAYLTARPYTFHTQTINQLEDKNFPIFKSDNEEILVFSKGKLGQATSSYKADKLESLSAQYDVRMFFDDDTPTLKAVGSSPVLDIPGIYSSIKEYRQYQSRSNPMEYIIREGSEEEEESDDPSGYSFYGWTGDTDYEDANVNPSVAETFAELERERNARRMGKKGQTKFSSEDYSWKNPPVKPKRKKMKNGKYRKEPAKKYVDRFMGNTKMGQEFPDRGQRYAVALNYVEKYYGKRGLDSVGARQNPEEYSANYMVPRDIHRLGKAADRLEDTYEDGQEVPEWWKSKLSVTAKDADTIADSLEYVAQNPNDCPPATQSLELNTKNRNNAIQSDYIRYGPLNLNDLRYYDDAAAHWKTDVATAKKSKCSNCVAFDISPRMLDCMPGPVSEPIEDEEGYLGYCWMHHFKCHSARTCYTWAAGGPIKKDKVSMEWQDRAFGKKNPAGALPIFTGEPTSKFSNKGMISAEVQIGRNVVKDVGEVVQSIYRGLVGGRTSMAERRMAMAVASMQKELSDRAKAKGANAIANLNVDYELIDQSATLTLIATADAIKMARAPKKNPGHSLEEDFEWMKKSAFELRSKEAEGEEVNGRAWWNQQISWIEKKYGTDPLDVTWATPLDTTDFDPYDKSEEFDKDGDVLPVHFLNQLKRIPMIKETTPERIMQIALNIGQGMATGSVDTDYTLDDFVIRQNPIPMQTSIQVAGYRNAAGAFVMKGKKFLILQRSTKETSKHGLWELPGGKVEKGETPREAAVIETKEEAGLDIKLKSNLGPHHDDKKKKTYHAYIAAPKKGQRVKLSEEHSAHKWVTAAEVFAMPDAKVSHHLLYFLKKNPEIFPISAQGYHKMVSSAITKARKNGGHAISYAAVVLTEESREELLSSFQIPEGWSEFAHHMTITMGPLTHKKGKHDFSEEYPIGSTVELQVVGVGMDDKVMAVEVEPPADISAKISYPHITVAVNTEEGGKPFHSNKLDNSEFTPVEFTLYGEVTEVAQPDPNPTKSNPRKNPSHSKKVEKGKKLYKHMNGKEPEKIEKKKIDMGDVWYQVGEGGCWQIGYMSGKETGNANQKYTHTFNEETQDGNFPKLYATMPESGKPLLIIQGGTWKIKTDDKGVAWIYD